MIMVTPYVEVKARLFRELEGYRRLLAMTDDQDARTLRGIIRRTEEDLRRTEQHRRCAPLELTRPALPEPCLKPACHAPKQCADLGYCNARDIAAAGLAPCGTAEWKRRRAAQRKPDLARKEGDRRIAPTSRCGMTEPNSLVLRIASASLTISALFIAAPRGSVGFTRDGGH
jgi:hypothetical protein